jgi:hypothetical protein
MSKNVGFSLGKKIILTTIMLVMILSIAQVLAEEDLLTQTSSGKGTLSGAIMPIESDAVVYVVREGEFKDNSIITSEKITEEGKFSFYNLPSGNYTLIIVPINPEYVSTTKYIEVFDNYDHVLSNMILSKSSEVGSVSGHVTPAIPGMIVHINDGPYDIIDETGAYTITGLSQGEYDLFIQVDENNNFHDASWGKVKIVAGKSVVDFDLNIQSRYMKNIFIDKEKTSLDKIQTLTQYTTIADTDKSLKYIANNGNKIILDTSLDTPPDLFIDPPDISAKVSKHMNTVYPCPKDNIELEIRNNINNMAYIKDFITENDIIGFVETCKTQNSYTVLGISPSDLIKDCRPHLYELLEKNKEDINPENLVYPYDLWINKECYTREYFSERFNDKKVASYDQRFFDKIYENRDIQFLEYVKYSILYPYGAKQPKIMNENGEIIYLKVEEENLPSQEEIDAHPENYDLNPTITESVDIPSKSITQTIKEKLGILFNWFK